LCSSSSGGVSPNRRQRPCGSAQSAHEHVQLMRTFPFPHANVLFDTQSKDPVGTEKKESMVFSVYRWGDSDTYAGWEGVENSALAFVAK